MKFCIITNGARLGHNGNEYTPYIGYYGTHNIQSEREGLGVPKIPLCVVFRGGRSPGRFGLTNPAPIFACEDEMTRRGAIEL